MTSSEGESQPPPRKRSRTSSNGDENGKKARGRPRVDTQDATAADRRRTQIRLAQRAYRQRKETTISSLQGQNTRLQTIIEQMNKSFLDFNDVALKSGVLQLSPALAQQLKAVKGAFVGLAKSAGENMNDEDEEGNAREVVLDRIVESPEASTATRVSKDSPPSQPNRLLIPQHTDVGWGYTTVFEDTSRQANTSLPPRQENHVHSTYFAPMPHSRYGAANAARELSLVRATPRLTVGQVLDQTRLQNFEGPDQLPFGLVDITAPDSQIFSASIPTPEVTPPLSRLSTPLLLPSLSIKSLPSSRTYSHDETTFARRLARSALEAGYHLLSSANHRPAALNYVFRLSLPYLTLDDLRDKFKGLLARGTSEDLDFWETPFIHLGGAGTHYPRKDHLGNVVPIPNSWTVRSIGPFPKKMIRAENSVDPSLSHDLAIDLTGFEGEWFDAHDVQGYLEDVKNCYINPRDSFTEVYIDIRKPPEPNELGSLLFSKGAHINLETSVTTPVPPGLSHRSSSSDSTSIDGTPPHSRPDVANQETYGLDMVAGFPNDGFKFSEVDVSAIFDQPLGLDLAPGFDTNVSAPLNGFDSVTFGELPASLRSGPGGGNTDQLTIVSQKQRQAAWIDVAKFVDGRQRPSSPSGPAARLINQRQNSSDIAFV